MTSSLFPNHGIGVDVSKNFNGELLSDQHTVTLKKRIDAKLKSGTDVLKAPEEPEAAEAASNVIDLMQVLKERLQGRQPHASSHTASSKPKRPPSRGKPRSR